MVLSSTSKLCLAELVLCLLILPLTMYLGWRHGRHGLLGYFYLHAFCLVRVAADIVSLPPSYRDLKHPTIATAVLSSVGLSPLMLGLSGHVYEVYVHLIHAKAEGKQEKESRRWLWFIEVQAHAISITGMVLVIIGSVNLATKNTTQASTNNNLRKAGALLILALWAFLVLYAIYPLRSTQTMVPNSQTRATLARWTICLVASALAVGVRCIYTVAYVFDGDAHSLNPVTGAFWVKIVFVVLAPFAAVALMCAGGWLSRRMSVLDIEEDGTFRTTGQGTATGPPETQVTTVKASSMSRA